MQKSIQDLQPLKDRILYDASDVISRKDLKGKLDSTVLEVVREGHCMWHIVTCSGTHQSHRRDFAYELVPEEAETMPHDKSMLVREKRGTVVRGRSID